LALRRQPRWRLGLGVLLVIALAAALVAACATASPPASASARVRGWQRDIAYLTTKLPTVRIDGLGSARRSVWNAAAARLSAQVPWLTNRQVIVRLLRMVAMIHDDETLFDLPAPPFYPIAAHWLGSHLYLLTVPSSDRQLLGAELVSIDGYPIDAVLSALRPEIDYQDVGVLRFEEAQQVNDADLLFWLGLTRSPASAAFTVRTTAGTVQTVRLPAIRIVAGHRPALPALAAAPTALYERHSTLPYWMLVLSSDHAVYLRYNQCIDGDGFQRLAVQTLAVLRRYPSYRLIVDLRGNGGGDTTPFDALISGIQTDRAINKRGRIFGLIDAGTDSSATYDAFELSRDTRAILMGQQVEDPIDEYGNDDFSLRLPYSGLTLQYTTKIVNPAQRPLVPPTSWSPRRCVRSSTVPIPSWRLRSITALDDRASLWLTNREARRKCGNWG
jgi:hypothetical protein